MTVIMLVMILLSGGVGAEPYAPVSVNLFPVKVSPSVYIVQGRAGIATDFEGFISNAGFVITDEGVVVFDALGTPSLGNELIKQIHQLTDKPIKMVITSHYHADHILGLEVFKKNGAEIIAPSGAEKYLEGGVGKERLEERKVSLSPWVQDETQLIHPDRYITQTETFRLGKHHFRLFYFGKAHSDGDLGMLVENEKVLFTGDLIFEGRIPFVGNADTKGWLEALTKLETGGIKALIPGHGPAARKPEQAIRMTRDYVAYLRSTMIEAVENLEDFDDVYKKTDWSAFEKLPAFEPANRINAYAVFLSLQDELLNQ